MAKAKATISCPACESEIAPDGKTLVKRSAKLVELQKLEKAVPELEAELTRLEKEIKEKKSGPVQLEGKTEVEASGKPWFRRGSR
jgi:hypothetical protein